METNLPFELRDQLSKAEQGLGTLLYAPLLPGIDNDLTGAGMWTSSGFARSHKEIGGSYHLVYVLQARVVINWYNPRHRNLVRTWMDCL